VAGVGGWGGGGGWHHARGAGGVGAEAWGGWDRVGAELLVGVGGELGLGGETGVLLLEVLLVRWWRGGWKPE